MPSVACRTIIGNSGINTSITRTNNNTQRHKLKTWRLKEAIGSNMSMKKNFLGFLKFDKAMVDKKEQNRHCYLKETFSH